MSVELTTAECDAIYSTARLPSREAPTALYLLGMQHALSNPARARELTGMEASYVVTIDYPPDWKPLPDPLHQDPELFAQTHRRAPEVTSHQMRTVDQFLDNFRPLRSLEQRIVGASHAEGTE